MCILKHVAAPREPMSFEIRSEWIWKWFRLLMRVSIHSLFGLASNLVAPISA